MKKTVYLFRKPHYLLIISYLFILNSIYSQQDTIFDDFTDSAKSKTLWEFADRTWSAGSSNNPTHGGVVPELGSIENGLLILKGNGEQYTGDIQGHNRNTRVGACLVSQNKYGSGSYEFKAKILPKEGALSAFWTFYYETYSNANTGNLNHEIDIEIKKNDTVFNQALCNTWVYENVYTTQTVNEFYNQDDGEFHLYRFEWHTGGDTITPSVSFYYDDVLKKTITTNIPYYKSKLWIGVWFPTWAGTANFETDSMVVDWVKIIPYNEANDIDPDSGSIVQQESYYEDPLKIPGRIEAEDFDKGSEGLAYHDTDDGNTGGAYRDNTDVDIEDWSDGMYALGYVVDDEWVEYTIKCDSAGYYGTWFKVASGLDGGSLHLSLDGEILTEELTFSGTGAWGNFEIIDGPVLYFPKGEQILQLYFDNGDINVDWIDIADTATYSGIQETTEDYSEENIFYPVPVSPSGQVSFSCQYNSAKLDIYDLSGHLINGSGILATKGLNTFAAPANTGTYILKLESKENILTQVLLVK